jgi:hypothetical protein
MGSNQTHSKSQVRIKAVIVLLTISLLFISANFTFPHSVSEGKSVVSPQQVIVVSNETFLNHQQNLLFTNDSYYVLPPVSVGFGRITAEMESAGIGYAVYIFSQEQFDHFKVIFPSIGHTNVVISSASEWANKSGFSYEAAGWGAGTMGHPLTVSYNVTQTGNYYVVLTDGIYGGVIPHQSYDYVYFLNEYFDSYSYQTANITKTVVVQEKDNLYLYIGTVFLVIAIAILLFYRRLRKITKQRPFQAM